MRKNVSSLGSAFFVGTEVDRNITYSITRLAREVLDMQIDESQTARQLVAAEAAA